MTVARQPYETLDPDSVALVLEDAAKNLRDAGRVVFDPWNLFEDKDGNDVEFDQRKGSVPCRACAVGHIDLSAWEVSRRRSHGQRGRAQRDDYIGNGGEVLLLYAEQAACAHAGANDWPRYRGIAPTNDRANYLTRLLGEHGGEKVAQLYEQAAAHVREHGLYAWPEDQPAVET